MPVTEPETPKALLADGYERCVEVLCAECMFVAFMSMSRPSGQKPTLEQFFTDLKWAGKDEALVKATLEICEKNDIKVTPVWPRVNSHALHFDLHM